MPPNLISEEIQLPPFGISLAEKSRNVLKNLFRVLAPLGLLLLAAEILLPADLFPHDIHFAPLHTVLETFAIVVALQVFGTGWFGSGIRVTGSMGLLACVFLATALLDLGHMLSYVGMPDFITPNNAHKGILFWLAARYMVAFGLLLMALSYGREARFYSSKYLILTLALLLVAALFWLIIMREAELPATFIPDVGLTPIKIWLEYGLVFVYGATAVWFFTLYEQMHAPALRIIGYAAGVMAVSELCFTLYMTVSDNFNVLGHLYKVLAYGILYRALFVSNVREPYRRLEVANQRLREVSRAVSEHFGTTLFDSLVAELSHQLGMRYVIILEFDESGSEQGRVIALTGGDELKLVQGQLYDLGSTPCLNAFKTNNCRIDCQACKKYPGEALLQDLRIESYIGIRLVDSKGMPLGVLAAFDRMPILHALPAEELMQIFAARASAELERMRSDQQLRDSEWRLRSILTNIQDGVFRTDEQQRLVWISPSAECITGYGQAELLHKPIADFHPDPEQHQVFLQRLEADGSVTGFEMQLRQKGGSLLWVSVNAHYYRDELGRILGVEGSVHDIQARKQAELELVSLNQELEAKVEQRTRQLQETNDELEAFSYSVSHDLRAPLRHVGGFASLLGSHYGEVLDEEGHVFIDRIQHGVARMGQLIEDLLALSQITRHTLQRIDLDASAMVRDVLQRLAEDDPGRQVDLRVMDDIHADADPKLLRIVLENLLGNAWKFTQHEPQARIEFGSALEAGRRVYFIRDNGAGFDMQYVSKLFTPFQRLHSATEYEGTGIGLATVARIIHRHGGEIHADATLGEGACFSFTL